MCKVRILVYFFVLSLLTGCEITDRYLQNLLGVEYASLPMYMDDFSDHDNGWATTVSEQGVVSYDQDAMRILIREPNADYWTTPGIQTGDSIASVDAMRVTGPVNNLYGEVCRWQNEDNYYAFLLSSDGYYGIIRVFQGERKVLTSGEMQTTTLIQPDHMANHLRADCVGNRLSLYLNWNKIAEVNDDTFSSGDTGLIASTLDEAGTDIRFDNFIVLDPARTGSE